MNKIDFKKIDFKKVAVAVGIVAFVALSVFFIFRKDYSQRTFDFLEGDFSWDMTKEEAIEYIEENTVQSWREIEVNDYLINNGFYYFHFDDDDKLECVRIYMGQDTSVLNTLNKWFGDYNNHKNSKYGNFGYYYWYGTMAGKKTEALLYCPSSDVYLQFSLEE